MKITVIYALADPMSKEPCYVGQTIRPRHRQWSYKESYRASNERLRDWIRRLQSANRMPMWIELEQCPRGTEADRAERDWIRLLREMGCDLRNSARGGTARTDRMAARVGQAEWLGLGNNAKATFDQAQQFYFEISQLFPKNDRIVRNARRACEILQQLRFTIENAAAAEHPSWNVLGHFVGESHHPGRMSFCDIRKVPADAARTNKLRDYIRAGNITVPMMSPWSAVSA